MRARWWGKSYIIVLGLLVLFGGVYFGKYTNALFLNAVRPVVRFASQTGNRTADIARVFFQSFSRADEIRRLRIENESLRAEIALLENVTRENKDLRAALGRETEDIQFVYARVIGISPSVADDYILVDAGYAEGVQNGMTVLVGGTVHIGSLAEVASHSAVVRLLSHAGEKVQVYLPHSQVSSVAIGQGGGVWEIQVPASIAVQEKEPVLSIGPPDFLIGYVEHVEKSDEGPFQVISVSNLFSLTDVQSVFLLTRTGQDDR